MNEKFTDVVTIYNDIPADEVNPRRFFRFVLKNCLIYNALTESGENTIQRIINSQSVLSKDTEQYKSPYEYAKLPEDVKEKFFTVQIDDFVVFGEVDDVVTNSEEFRRLQEKYEDNGFSVTGVNTYTKGGKTNHIHIMHQ